MWKRKNINTLLQGIIRYLWWISVPPRHIWHETLQRLSSQYVTTVFVANDEGAPSQCDFSTMHDSTPDFFITITTNPQLPEKTKNLPYNPFTYSVLTTRVFKMFLQHVTDNLLNHSVAVKAVGFVCKTVFEKYSCGYCHLLVFLFEEDKINNPADIDSAICAKALIETNFHYFARYKTITKMMIHGTCR